MSLEFWRAEKERLGELLDRAEAAHDSFTFDDIFPRYKKACDEYRQCVLSEAPFTGCMF